MLIISLLEPEDFLKVPFWARFLYPSRPFRSIENNNDRNYPGGLPYVAYLGMCR